MYLFCRDRIVDIPEYYHSTTFILSDPSKTRYDLLSAYYYFVNNPNKSVIKAYM